MGYCVHQEKCEFHLPNEFKWAALASLKAQFPGDRHITSCTTLEEALNVCGYNCMTDPTLGDITKVMFEWEKSGNEKYVFGAIAKFVEAGSFVQFRGEDGAHWRWVFDGESVKQVYATLVF